ncbi:MAG: thioredoxin family protein [Methanosarcinales archaeon]|nr:thioredoxin family protein [Methanosarcinales archaeon]
MLKYSYKNSLLALLIALFILSAAPIAAASAEFSVGSGADDWWIDFPDGHVSSGSEVSHPQWLLDALQDGPVLIYAHKQCSYCAPQEEALDELLPEYEGQIDFIDVDAEKGDPKSGEVAIYDPDGGPHYVPLTIVATLVEDQDGNVAVGWHSSEAVTGKDWIQSYIEDAIYYHDQNSAGWSQ